MIYDKEGDNIDSLHDSNEKEEGKKEDRFSSTPPLLETNPSIDSINIPKLMTKSSTMSASAANNKLTRYQEDFEEIEFLGRGAFSEVVKVR